MSKHWSILTSNLLKRISHKSQLGTLIRLSGHVAIKQSTQKLTYVIIIIIIAMNTPSNASYCWWQFAQWQASICRLVKVICWHLFTVIDWDPRAARLSYFLTIGRRRWVKLTGMYILTLNYPTHLLVRK